jgi:hypothetical protein
MSAVCAALLFLLTLPLCRERFKVHGAVGRGRGSGPSLTHGGLNVVLWCCWDPLEAPAAGLMAGIWWMKTGGLWE